MSQTLNIDPCELAMLPMVRLSPDAEPSETYCGCVSCKPGSPYYDVINTGLWSYQLYTYLELLEQMFGKHIESEVSDWLLDMLNANNHAGDRLETVFALIKHAKQASKATMDTGHGLSSVPVEMSIALAMLVELPESPDFAVSTGDRQTRIRLINADLDQNFAASLKRAATDVYNILLPVLAGLSTEVEDKIQARNA